MQEKPLTALAHSLRMFAEDADVLHGFYTRRAGARYGLVVDDVFLKPEVRDA